MKVVIKLGGSLLDSAESRARLAHEIAAASRDQEIVVVHGGGKQMTRYLADRGIESRFVNGLRVTTDEVIDAVLKVFAGTVNAELVSSLRAAGANSVGLSGVSAGILDAELLDPELGHVGRPIRSNPALFNVLIGAGFLPVVACVGGDAAGRIYNVNGDQVASAVAAGFGARKLIFLTDVDGVRGADGSVAAKLTAGETIDLIRGGIASKGMQAKLESAVAALRAGVGEILIAPGAVEGIVGKALAGEPVGTRVVC